MWWLPAYLHSIYELVHSDPPLQGNESASSPETPTCTWVCASLFTTPTPFENEKSLHRWIIKNDRQKCLGDTTGCRLWLCISPASQLEQNELSDGVYTVYSVRVCVYTFHIWSKLSCQKCLLIDIESVRASMCVWVCAPCTSLRRHFLGGTLKQASASPKSVPY